MRCGKYHFVDCSALLCPGGGIGRRARFRFWFREEWEFESPPGYQSQNQCPSGGMVYAADSKPVVLWHVSSTLTSGTN